MIDLGSAPGAWSQYAAEKVGLKGRVVALDILPMDAFRTEFMGRQWGVPSEFLVYDGQPYYAKDLLAYTLLHGVLIRPAGPEHLDRIAALWKVYDEFPFKDAQLHPYWSNAPSPWESALRSVTSI